MRTKLFILYAVFAHIPYAYADLSGQSLSKEPVFQKNMEGFYTGLILGGQFGQSSDKTGSFGYNADNDKWDYNQSGVNAGVAAGYNYALNQILIGPEIELGYLGMKGEGAQPLSPALDTVGKSSGDFYAAFRARAGIPLNQSLLFGTAGVIGVNHASQVIDNCNIAPCGGSTVYARDNGFIWGYTVGGGAEHLFNNGWSAKLEYLYFSLNNQTFNGMTDLGNTYEWTGKTNGSIIRAGLNYHY